MIWRCRLFLLTRCTTHEQATWSALKRHLDFHTECMQGSEDGIPFAVRLSFYELVNKAGFSSTYQEKVYWEVWKIQLKVVNASQSSAGMQLL
jgi:hypothetical protein